MAWRETSDGLVQDYEFEDFARAIEFVNQVAKIAEATGHHPDILVHDWNQVRLTLSTHSAGGAITDADRDLAEAIDNL
jgi:4a-hydroxytetrahydrobiopterin dehydratase